MAILPKKGKKVVVQDLFLEFLEYSYIHITAHTAWFWLLCCSK